MIQKAQDKLDYTLALLSTVADGKRQGCIINSLHQVTSSFPAKFTVTLNRESETAKAVEASGMFSVTLLGADCPESIVNDFGYKSGRAGDGQVWQYGLVAVSGLLLIGTVLLLLTSRLSVSDMVQKPYGFGTTEDNKLDLEEPDRLIDALVAEGMQILNVTVGNPYYNPHINRPYRKGGYEPPEAPAAGLDRFEVIERHIKERHPSLCVVGSGMSYYREDLIEQSERLLAEGICDLVGYGRMWLAYPDFYRDAQAGSFDPKKCCLACSGCTALMRAGQVSGCAVFHEYYRELYRKIKQ